MTIDERQVDLRRFQNQVSGITRHDVSSFVFDETQKYGWVTACNSGQRLLIGYIWRTDDYPWLNIWRYMRDGRVEARGLEFGTTGYHQPFEQLVKTGKLLGNPLVDYIDAGQTVSRSWSVFLLRLPDGYHGVTRISYEEGRLILLEHGKQNPRTLQLEVGRLFDN